MGVLAHLARGATDGVPPHPRLEFAASPNSLETTFQGTGAFSARAHPAHRALVSNRRSLPLPAASPVAFTRGYATGNIKHALDHRGRQNALCGEHS
jgi:hypothetical protein